VSVKKFLQGIISSAIAGEASTSAMHSTQPAMGCPKQRVYRRRHNSVITVACTCNRPRGVFWSPEAALCVTWRGVNRCVITEVPFLYRSVQQGCVMQTYIGQLNHSSCFLDKLKRNTGNSNANLFCKKLRWCDFHSNLYVSYTENSTSSNSVFYEKVKVHVTITSHKPTMQS